MFTNTTTLSDFANPSSQRAAFAKMQSSGRLWPKNDNGVRRSKKKQGSKVAKTTPQAHQVRPHLFEMYYSKHTDLNL